MMTAYAVIAQEALRIRVDGRLGHGEEIRHGPLATSETFDSPKNQQIRATFFFFLWVLMLAVNLS